MISNLEAVEQSLGLEAGKLTEMITAEETHELDLENVVILQKTAYDTRIENIKKESGNAAIEMAVKKARTENGFEFQGKTIDNLIAAAKAKGEAEAKVEPEEKYKTLKTEFETLQTRLVEKEGEITEIKTSHQRQAEANEIKGEVFKHIPEKTLVSKATIMTEAQTQGYSFVKEEGKIVVKDSNGDTVKDENFSPTTVKDFMTTFVTPYVAKTEGGSGEGDRSQQAKAGSIEAFEKEAEKAGWTATFKNEEMLKRMTAGTLKL